MPMLRITVTDQGARLHGASACLIATLRRLLARDNGPVTVMVHGYKYEPGQPGRCPHDTLFARTRGHDTDTATGHNSRIVSWPHHLGLRGQPDEGIGISFGWPAYCSIREAHRRAGSAGQALAGLIENIHRLDPDRPVLAVGHSLGARVILSAIRAGRPGAMSRAVLLAAAEFSETTRAILRAPQGRHTQVLNVTSRENDLFDFLLERVVAPETAGDRMLGHFGAHLPNMVTLQLDDRDSLTALRHAGYPIAAPDRRVCHWSPYLRDGVFPLYRAVLSGAMPLPRLQSLLPETCAPRWSRLFPSQITPMFAARLRPLPQGLPTD